METDVLISLLKHVAVPEGDDPQAGTLGCPPSLAVATIASSFNLVPKLLTLLSPLTCLAKGLQQFVSIPLPPPLPEQRE